MCGILGHINIDSQANTKWVKVGLDHMVHRGPDGSNTWLSDDKKVCFGHRRLSIIDLSNKADQPMLTDDNQIVITFNGEIYNYFQIKKELTELDIKFNTASDTEVLLKAYQTWGNDFIKKINGMFAFAIFDKNRNHVLIYRDRAGEKPLFYKKNDKELFFSSELKPFLSECQSVEIDNQALGSYLNMGFIPGQYCILKGYNKLKAGHYLTYCLSKNELKIERYWSPKNNSRKGDKSSDELVDDLEQLLEKSIQRQLIADVPLGVLLSGGLDSSLITAIASKFKPNLKTYTVTFPDNKMYDESYHAKLIANHFSTIHKTLEVKLPSPEILYKLAAQFDEPINDSSMIPTFLVTQMVKQECTVALGGDGGDELFGGYSHYQRLLKFKKLTQFFPQPVRHLMHYTHELLPIGHPYKNWLFALSVDLNRDVPLIAQYFQPNYIKKLLNSKYRTQAFYPSNNLLYNHDFISQMMLNDFMNYLPEDILVKVDRSSMINSLEMRAPFLDMDIIAFAFNEVPSNLKVTTKNKKILLKLLAKRILPETFDLKRKQGFVLPLKEWFKDGEWHDFLKDHLFSENQKIFNHKMINDLIIGQKNGRNNTERLFSLLMYQLWLETYKIY